MDMQLTSHMGKMYELSIRSKQLPRDGKAQLKSGYYYSRTVSLMMFELRRVAVTRYWTMQLGEACGSWCLRTRP